MRFTANASTTARHYLATLLGALPPAILCNLEGIDLLGMAVVYADPIVAAIFVVVFIGLCAFPMLAMQVWAKRLNLGISWLGAILRCSGLVFTWAVSGVLLWGLFIALMREFGGELEYLDWMLLLAGMMLFSVAYINALTLAIMVRDSNLLQILWPSIIAAVPILVILVVLSQAHGMLFEAIRPMISFEEALLFYPLNYVFFLAAVLVQAKLLFPMSIFERSPDHNEYGPALTTLRNHREERTRAAQRADSDEA